MEGRCKFTHGGQADGIKCKFPHPKPCWNFKKKSGCKVKNCEYMHPKVCKFALQNKKCQREDCSFFHPIQPTTGNTGASNAKKVSGKPGPPKDGPPKAYTPVKSTNQCTLESEKQSSASNNVDMAVFLEQQQAFQMKMLEMMQGIMMQRQEKNNNFATHKQCPHSQ